MDAPGRAARGKRELKMRVLFLVTKADLGGAQVHVLDLLRGFRNVLDMVVGVGEEGYFTDGVRRLGVPFQVIPNLVHPIEPSKDVRALVDVARLIRQSRADIVHTHTSKAGLIGRLAARAVGVPCIFTAHTWCFTEGISKKQQMIGIPAERIAGMCSAAIINVSRANHDIAMRHRISNSRKMLTIWNGIPDTDWRAQPASPGIPLIAMVARLVEQKDQRTLLRALALMDCKARVLLAGDGPNLESLEIEALRLGVRDRVEFLGRRLDVERILAGAHIFALPSKWEGFPLSILEAMRAGLPVVASDVGGVSEAVEDGRTGYLVRRGDVQMLAQKLSALAGDPALRRRMGNLGRQRYEEQFTLKIMLQRTMAVYQTAAPRAAAAIPEIQAAALPVSTSQMSKLRSGR